MPSSGRSRWRSCSSLQQWFSGVIADERQRKTLQYLLASCLTSSEIVIGKLTARLLLTAVFIGLSLPIYVILSFLGGVDPDMVVFFFAASGSTMFFLGTLAILVSTHAKRPREAVSVVHSRTRLVAWSHDALDVRAMARRSLAGSLRLDSTTERNTGGK